MAYSFSSNIFSILIPFPPCIYRDGISFWSIISFVKFKIFDFQLFSSSSSNISCTYYDFRKPATTKKKQSITLLLYSRDLISKYCDLISWLRLCLFYWQTSLKTHNGCKSNVRHNRELGSCSITLRFYCARQHWSLCIKSFKCYVVIKGANGIDGAESILGQIFRVANTYYCAISFID